MKLRKLLALTLALMLAFSLVGCGEKTDVEVTEDAAEPSPETETIADKVLLPGYEYTNAEPYVGEICDYILKSDGGNYSPADVTIPYVTVLETDDTDPTDILVWATGAIFNYALRNTTLTTESGGAFAGLFHLKAEDETVTVTEFDRVGDGSNYGPDSKRIFGMRDGLYDKFINGSGDTEAVRNQFIADYVNHNGIYITQYQDYGWAPVSVVNAPPTTDEENLYTLDSNLGYTAVYDLRDFSYSSTGDNEEMFGGVDDLQGLLVTVERSESDAEAALDELTAALAEYDVTRGTFGSIEGEVIRVSEPKEGSVSEYVIIPAKTGSLLLYMSDGWFEAEDEAAEIAASDAIANLVDSIKLK